MTARARLADAQARPATAVLRAPAAVVGAGVAGVRLVVDAAGVSAGRGALALALLAAALGTVAATLVPHRAAVRGSLPASAVAPVALITVLTAVAGGALLGGPLLGALDRRYGPLWALTGLVASAALVAVQARRSVPGLARAAAARVADATSSAASDRLDGAQPLLEVRDVDFGYGRLQVLHGISLEVADGELVALLGVNGAGKSTLLRAISGLGLPTSGAIRFAGDDITYLDAEARVRRGVVQVPGGRAVFASMSVIDNLRASGYSLDRNELEAAIDDVLLTFPRLAERQHQDAASLSGGEQQMLALAKALLLRPRLLLIDELSLGLAPVIVGQLIELVRQINQAGTAVVLVEQSVNIALELADHAFFLERGAVQFDGPSADLLGRDDLLRAVFLDGAAR